jgi:Domain of unknown function (DUF1906)
MLTVRRNLIQAVVAIGKIGQPARSGPGSNGTTRTARRLSALIAIVVIPSLVCVASAANSSLAASRAGRSAAAGPGSSAGGPAAGGSTRPQPAAGGSAGPQPAAGGSAGPEPAAGPLASGVLTATTSARGSSGGGVKAISYRGYRFEVPRSWPLIDLAKHPEACVRFDVHAVYVGKPGADQDCPAWLLGATESVLIQPDGPRARRRTTEDPVADEITATAPRISVTATFDTTPSVVLRILASARLPAPASVQPDPSGSAPTRSGSSASAADSGQALAVSAQRQDSLFKYGYGVVPPPALPSNVGNDVGLGFDTCAAPSATVMRAWHRDSPYRAIGIYIGGSDRACYQRNLTSAWVRREAASGWRFIPMYAGPQAAIGQLSRPQEQGVAAARDAVEQAGRLGFGPGTPVYYDMEAYPASDGPSVLRFLSAWTTELHKLGYLSGVYSSSESAIQALAGVYHDRKYAVPDVIYDALWNGARNVSDPAYRAGEWPDSRRLHQFSGNVLQTYGGYTMQIDQDYMDVGLTAPGGTAQSSPAATGAHGTVQMFYEGSDHQLWAESRNSSGRWSRTDLGGYLTSAPAVVRVGSTDIDVLYRGLGGYLWLRVRVGSRWRRPVRLTIMGDLGGPPRAVAQPNGVIDVFWRGSHDDHLWHGQYSPGEGWAGPERLLGSLDSSPYPVERQSGLVEVFYMGTDRKLWRVVRGLGQGFSRPQSLGMGPLGGAPQAVALPDGQIDVCWQGYTSPRNIWAAFISPAGRARGPVKLGGTLSGQPWPVVADGGEVVLFRGADGVLQMLARKSNGRWSGPLVVSKQWVLESPPFAAAGQPGEALDVFWLGKGGMLWTGRKSSRYGKWLGPVDLGGRAG